MASLHLGAVFVDIGRHMIDIEFEGIRPRVLDFPRMFHPASQGRAVEAGDDRDIQRRFQ